MSHCEDSRYTDVGWYNRTGIMRAVTMALRQFNEKTQLSYTLSNLKNRFKNLKKWYAMCLNLKSRFGWGWDDEKNMPVPLSEDAWEEMFAINKDYKTLKGKSFNFMDQMHIITSTSMARGDLGAGDFGNSYLDQRDEPNMDDDDLLFDMIQNDGDPNPLDNQQPTLTEDIPPQTTDHTPTPKSTPHNTATVAQTYVSLSLMDLNTAPTGQLLHIFMGEENYWEEVDDTLILLHTAPGSAADMRVLRWALESGGFKVPEDEVLQCPCGKGHCRKRTSKTSKSYGRSFYVCPQSTRPFFFRGRGAPFLPRSAANFSPGLSLSSWLTLSFPFLFTFFTKTWHLLHIWSLVAGEATSRAPAPTKDTPAVGQEEGPPTSSSTAENVSGTGVATSKMCPGGTSRHQ
ncbi:hypothetical protein Taro_018284 [Colocasia esculenta]|uniref:Myb/SANT-like domain-containing protein n=1 Tax=Colocasia esculenta TaxID=4460 RepID=A0A843UQA2_COLES|nr:hypothetical protein [Colocasia esculenta]